MRKQGWRKLVPEWRYKPDDTCNRASNAKPHQGGEEEEGGGRGSFLLSKQDKGGQSPPVGTKCAAACLRPHKRAWRMQTSDQISLSDLLHIWSVHPSFGELTALLGEWTLSFLHIRETTGKADSKVIQSLVGGSLPSFYLKWSERHRSPPCRESGYLLFSQLVLLLSLGQRDLVSPPRFAWGAGHNPHGVQTQLWGEDKPLCVQLKINMKT